jgi:hypothetical protein
MNEANIRKVLDRFMEVFETNLERNAEFWKRTQGQKRNKITVHQAVGVFLESYKQVMRELCVSGCPYGEIWECKK